MGAARQISTWTAIKAYTIWIKLKIRDVKYGKVSVQF